MLNIKKVRSSKKVSTEELASHLNIDESMLLSFENGDEKPNFKTILAIAEFLNVSVDELLGGPSVNIFHSVRFPILDSIPNGIPLNSITDIEYFDEFYDDFSSTGEYLAVQMNDDSMAPTILANDILIVEGDFLVNDGEIAIVIVDDTDTYCRKVIKTDHGGIKLVPNNPEYNKYKIMHFTYSDTIKGRVRILGKVIELRRPV